LDLVKLVKEASGNNNNLEQAAMLFSTHDAVGRGLSKMITRQDLPSVVGKLKVNLTCQLLHSIQELAESRK
jgi:hypothetical protein